MNTFIKRGLYCALLVGGFSLIGISAANAAEAPSTSGSDGIVSGSQVVSDVAAPVALSGNAISVLGDSSAGQGTTAAPTVPDAAPLGVAPITTGVDGFASGTQAVVAMDAPATVSGNAISVLGDSSSTGSNTGTAAPAGQPTAASPSTSGVDSVLGGTQVAPVITAPVGADGNAISVIGDSNSTGGESTPTSGASTTGASPTTTGADSTLGGTQVLTNLSAPVTVQGNAISVVGDSGSDGATNTASAPAATTSSVAPTATGANSFLGGAQIVPVIAVPILPSDNAVSVGGDSDTVAPTSTGTGTTATSATGTQPTTLVGSTPSSIGTGNSSLAALNVTTLATLASAGTTPLSFLALGLLLGLAGLGLVARRGVRTA